MRGLDPRWAQCILGTDNPQGVSSVCISFLAFPKALTPGCYAGGFFIFKKRRGRFGVYGSWCGKQEKAPLNPSSDACLTPSQALKDLLHWVRPTSLPPSVFTLPQSSNSVVKSLTIASKILRYFLCIAAYLLLLLMQVLGVGVPFFGRCFVAFLTTLDKISCAVVK